MTPFFHPLFELYLLVHFIFAFQDLQNSVPRGPPFGLFWSVKSTVLHAKDDNFKPVMGAQTRNLWRAEQILAIKGKRMGVGGGG